MTDRKKSHVEFHNILVLDIVFAMNFVVFSLFCFWLFFAPAGEFWLAYNWFISHSIRFLRRML